jgi:hypothetical protein
LGTALIITIARPLRAACCDLGEPVRYFRVTPAGRDQMLQAVMTGPGIAAAAASDTQCVQLSGEVTENDIAVAWHCAGAPLFVRMH